MVTRYRITSANDCNFRDPKCWCFEGWDAKTDCWIKLHQVGNPRQDKDDGSNVEKDATQHSGIGGEEQQTKKHKKNVVDDDDDDGYTFPQRHQSTPNFVIERPDYYWAYWLRIMECFGNQKNTGTQLSRIELHFEEDMAYAIGK